MTQYLTFFLGGGKQVKRNTSANFNMDLLNNFYRKSKVGRLGLSSQGSKVLSFNLPERNLAPQDSIVGILNMHIKVQCDKLACIIKWFVADLYVCLCQGQIKINMKFTEAI